jgi:YfiH family protein
MGGAMSHLTPQWLIPEWPAPSAVRALSTRRVGGVSLEPYASLNLGDRVEDAPVAVASNRRILRQFAGLPEEPSWLTQVHGTQVLDLDASSAAESASASGRLGDAAVTGRPGTVCAILTADCLPVLLAAGSGKRVGAVHAGWRGLAAGVIEAAVRAMGTPPGEMLAWLGPAIGPLHFEIGLEVRDELLRADPGAADAFTRNARGRFMADLFAIARRRLAGVGVERVYGGGECTYALADQYFSHRRDRRTGRQATLIWLD